MIVLVNLEQQRLLDHLAQGSDRFDREFEELKDTMPSTTTPLTGVPEPHVHGCTVRRLSQQQGRGFSFAARRCVSCVTVLRICSWQDSDRHF